MDEEWISITDAAERLTKAGDAVTRSTLSRYLSKHKAALSSRKNGRETQIDYVRLKAHRSENIRIENNSPMSYGSASPIPSKTGNAEERTPSPVTGPARKSLAEAEIKELELAKIRRKITPTSEVDKAGRDAIALMLSAFERAVDSEAASLSVKYGWDERTIRLALKSFARVGVDVFHREVLESLDRFRRSEDAFLLEEPGSVPEVATDRLQ